MKEKQADNKISSDSKSVADSLEPRASNRSREKAKEEVSEKESSDKKSEGKESKPADGSGEDESGGKPVRF